jgi:hypothetical protein
MDENPVPTKRQLPVVQMPDALKHFDGDPWGVRLCALALSSLKYVGVGVGVYLAHTFLK